MKSEEVASVQEGRLLLLYRPRFRAKIAQPIDEVEVEELAPMTARIMEGLT